MVQIECKQLPALPLASVESLHKVGRRVVYSSAIVLYAKSFQENCEFGGSELGAIITDDHFRQTVSVKDVLEEGYDSI